MPLKTSQPSEEIRAFRCPICQRIVEIDNESKLYVKLEGKIKWGEDGDLIATANRSSPYRICRGCFVHLFQEDAQNIQKVPPLKDGIKIRPL